MVIDLGCGKYPRPDADVRVDFNDYPHVDVKHDLLNTPYPFESFSADKIYLWDVIEHINAFEISKVIWECARVLKTGGILDITCPDIRWVAERIVKDDWKERTKEKWLNRFPLDFVNAMSYIYGGFYHPQEYKVKGMGHVAGYDEESLKYKLSNLMLEDMSLVKWGSIERVLDPRHECILRIQAVK